VWSHTDYAPTSTAWLPDQPIGGWLYLFGLGIVATPFVVLVQTVLILAGTHAGPIVSSGGAPTLFGLKLVEVSVSALQFVGAVLLLVLFLQRRRKFFRAWLIYMVTVAVLLTIDAFADVLISHDPSRAIALFGAPLRSIPGLAIWTLYFIRSRRAEATFVR
jgi:hypothetical protein